MHASVISAFPKRGFAQCPAQTLDPWFVVQTMDWVAQCPAQTLDPWFVIQTMDWLRNPGIARAKSLDQDNHGIALLKAWIRTILGLPYAMRRSDMSVIFLINDGYSKYIHIPLYQIT